MLSALRVFNPEPQPHAALICCSSVCPVDIFPNVAAMSRCHTRRQKAGARHACQRDRASERSRLRAIVPQRDRASERSSLRTIVPQSDHPSERSSPQSDRPSERSSLRAIVPQSDCASDNCAPERSRVRLQSNRVSGFRTITRQASERSRVRLQSDRASGFRAIARQASASDSRASERLMRQTCAHAQMHARACSQTSTLVHAAMHSCARAFTHTRNHAHTARAHTWHKARKPVCMYSMYARAHKANVPGSGDRVEDHGMRSLIERRASGYLCQKAANGEKQRVCGVVNGAGY